MFFQTFAKNELLAQQGKFSRIWWISSKNCKKCKKSKNERIVDESSLLRSTYCTICIEKTLIRTLPVRAFRRNQLVQKSNLRVTQVLCLINNVNTKIMDGPVFYWIYMKLASLLGALRWSRFYWFLLAEDEFEGIAPHFYLGGCFFFSISW